MIHNNPDETNGHDVLDKVEEMSIASDIPGGTENVEDVDRLQLGQSAPGEDEAFALERLESADPRSLALTLAQARMLYASLLHQAARVGRKGRPSPTTVHALGTLIDLAGDLRRPRGLRLAVEVGLALLSAAENPFTRGVLHYFVANAWSSLRAVRTRADEPNPAFSWDEPEGVEEIAHLRAADEAFALVLSGDPFEPPDDRPSDGEGENASRDGDAVGDDSSAAEPLLTRGAWSRRRQVLSNLGNALNARGRLIEAIEAWDAALAMDPSFGMALGNRGMGLEWYTSLAYDPGHKWYLIREAHRSLLAAEGATGVYPAAADAFARVRARIESRVPPGVLEAPDAQWEPSRKWSEEEQRYRQWCADERLFLNDLNDLTTAPIAMADVLMLPNLVTALDEGPALLGFFNQLKQEFVAARWLLYRGLWREGVHFADRDVTLVNTLDYPVYTIGAEEVKLAYRSFYSLFDKIAFFLNDYLALGIPERAVNFKTLWYNRRESRFGPRADLVARRNAPLRALYWLSQDLFTPGERTSDLASQRMAEIRQELEHKYLKLHDYHPEVTGRSQRPGNIAHDRIAYSISGSELESRALRLARLVRAALVYLAFAVRVEEVDRERARGRAMRTVSADTALWEDDWKR